MIYNLPSGFSLNDFYENRDKLDYMLFSNKTALDRSKLKDFFENIAIIDYNTKYLEELDVMYEMESNLFLRMSEFPNLEFSADEQDMCMHAVSQSQINYPRDGIDFCMIPIRDPQPGSIQSISMYDAVVDRLKFIFSDFEPLYGILEKDTGSWQEFYLELCTLSYLVSPFRIPCCYDSDYLYMVMLSISDRLNDNYSESVFVADEILDRIAEDVSDYCQLDYMNRVYYAYLTTVLNEDLEIDSFRYVRGEIHDLTKLCSIFDKKTGRDPKYKSRLGVASVLSISEQNDVDKYQMMRDFIGSPESRRNRILNRGLYDDI